MWLKGILLLAHMDVVEAKREDWTRDPFKLVEENGNFYARARGVIDDKAEAAIWVDSLIRYRQVRKPEVPSMGRSGSRSMSAISLMRGFLRASAASVW